MKESCEISWLFLCCLKKGVKLLEQGEIKKVLKIGKQYKYKELCELLNEPWTEACNKKPLQLEE